jgi:LAS superfamily LD-carboxypeptidase LdcB
VQLNAKFWLKKGVNMKFGAQDVVISEGNLHLLQECDLLGLNDLNLVNYPKQAARPEQGTKPEQSVKVLPQLIPALSVLVQKATDAGFDMRIASGFRSFERQLTIWNNKAYGLRPVLDQSEQPLDLNLLSDDEKVFAILHWSALPGASRHHWGTDIDVYDASSMPADYQLQLTLEETQGNGCCAEFHLWLTQELQSSQEFFRPYIPGVGSISPEPWHLSYAPLARLFATQLTEDILRKKIQETDMALKDSILKNLSDIFNQYIKPYQ